jgi:NADH-quinone oxidoreductase subunit N
VTALASVLAQVETFNTPEIEWYAIVPLLILVGGALVMMVKAALLPNLMRPGIFALGTVVIASAALIDACFLWNDVQDNGPKSVIAGALELDGFSVFFIILTCIALILAALFADSHLRREGMEGCEPYVLMLLSATGGIVMAMASDLIVLFLGLETLSIALYVLAASDLRRKESQEASIKYFVLGGMSSAFFLYGIALVYGSTGSTNLFAITEFFANNVLLENGLLLAGLALLLVGLGFKVAAVPFHTWVPDVYQGSPTPVTGFMASVAKAAGFAALLRVFVVAFETYELDWKPMVWALAVLTMVVGSVLAVVQTDVKRMLAYSSISHAGFVLVGVQAASETGTGAALFYLLAYTFMVLGSFAIVALVGPPGDANHDLSTFKGLSRRQPLLAFAFTVFLLAQAGVPLTSGFFAKFYVIDAAVDAESYALAVIAMVSAVIAAFLYLRVIVVMYLSEPEDGAVEPAGPRVRIPAAAAAGLVVAFAFTVVVGFLPGEVIDFARDAVPVLVAGP